MPDLSIEEAFQLIERGEKTAFEALYNRYYDRIYSTALQLCKVEMLAQDIVQDSFLKVWEKRHELTGIKDPEAWLFTLARNKAKNLIRDTMVGEHYLSLAKQFFKQEENTPEEQLIVRQRKALLEKSLQTLTVKQREMYLLSRHEGLTYEEIAQKTGIGRETVKEHIAKALNKLKAFISEHKDELITIALIIFS